MGRPRKTVEHPVEIMKLMELYKKFQDGETIISLARKLDMDSLLLNNWMKEIETIDKILKSEEVHYEEKEIWKNMYLKAAYRLEQLENQKSDS
ncbi:hypothetical protein [Sphingobacterium cavernae]|uniref:hypothetical protein n=1 Tax=Sphingobacterium cavernae TaxID=2592657 RepID=UPI00122FC036|nr:hypothetical protein [Sphingobacterium cavernae]